MKLDQIFILFPVGPDKYAVKFFDTKEEGEIFRAKMAYSLETLRRYCKQSGIRIEEFVAIQEKAALS